MATPKTNQRVFHEIRSVRWRAANWLTLATITSTSCHGTQ